MNNPDEASARGLWSDPEFLDNVSELNPQLKHTQFADFHGHGWVFRAVFKKDRKGNFLDHQGSVVPDVDHRPAHGSGAHAGVSQGTAPAASPSKPRSTPQRDGVPVHLMDIHLEKGMHCIDCHFVQDVHGNTKLYGEVRAAIEIQCIDCHGTVSKYATLRTTGPAALDLGKDNPQGGRDLTTLRTPFGKRRFERQGDKLIQNSMVENDLSWEVVQTKDVIDPKHPQLQREGPPGQDGPLRQERTDSNGATCRR